MQVLENCLTEKQKLVQAIFMAKFRGFLSYYFLLIAHTSQVLHQEPHGCLKHHMVYDSGPNVSPQLALGGLHGLVHLGLCACETGAASVKEGGNRP